MDLESVQESHVHRYIDEYPSRPGSIQKIHKSDEEKCNTNFVESMDLASSA